jgi:hypothetical protein
MAVVIKSSRVGIKDEKLVKGQTDLVIGIGDGASMSVVEKKPPKLLQEPRKSHRLPHTLAILK